MNCPKCKNKTKVVNSFSILTPHKLNQETIKRLQLKMDDCIIRRRKCVECNKIFLTYESIYEPLLGF